MQKASGHPRRGSHSFVGTRFQVCFTPLAAVLFAFPSRYLFAIGRHRVFRLGGWAPRIRTGFHVSRPTWDPTRPQPPFRVRGFHPLWPDFPDRSAMELDATSWSRNPGKHAFRFGLIRFRSPLLAESLLMSSPPGTEMFHFPGCRPATLCVQAAVVEVCSTGFPHSETCGSIRVANPRRFSQLTASFIALWRQGIRRVPVYAWPKPETRASVRLPQYTLHCLPNSIPFVKELRALATIRHSRPARLAPSAPLYL